MTLKVGNNPAFIRHIIRSISLLKWNENYMIRNKSNIFSVDGGINWKRNRKLLQQCPMGIDAFSVHFWLKAGSTEKILDSFLKSKSLENLT